MSKGIGGFVERIRSTIVGVPNGVRNTELDTLDRTYDSGSSAGSEVIKNAAEVLEKTPVLLGDVTARCNLSKISKQEKTGNISQRMYLYFTPKEGSHVVINDRIIDTKEVFRKDLVNFFGEEMLKDGGIKVHSNYISFPTEEIFEQWRKKNFLSPKEENLVLDKKPVGKKIVIIGTGDVGQSIARELRDYHNAQQIPCEIMFLNRHSESSIKRALDIDNAKKGDYAKCVGAETPDEIRGADLIFMTAGAKAGLIGAKSREEALLYNIQPMFIFGEYIKTYAPDSKLIVVTNPVEIVSKIMQELSGLPPKNVIGSGVGLDSIRYTSFIQKELAVYGIGEPVNAMVVGQHDKGGMVFLRENITIDNRPISEISKCGMLNDDRVKDLLDEVEKKVEVEGISLINKKDGKGACDTPAAAAAKLGTSWLYGGKDQEILSAAVFSEKGKGPYGRQKDCYLGLPIRFGSNGEFVVAEDCKISSNNAVALCGVADGLIQKREQLQDLKLLLPVSQRLNALLEKTEKRSSVHEHVVNIKPFSEVDLRASYSSLQELFNCENIDGKNVISVRKPEELSPTKEILSLLGEAMRGVNIIDQSSRYDFIDGKMVLPDSPELQNFVSDVFRPRTPSSSVGSPDVRKINKSTQVSKEASNQDSPDR